MPYKTNCELPKMVRENLPEHGQDIYREAFNSAWEEYKESSERRGETLQERKLHTKLPGAQLRKYMRRILKETG